MAPFKPDIKNFGALQGSVVVITGMALNGKYLAS